jgi:hypothetical protein
MAAEKIRPLPVFADWDGDGVGFFIQIRRGQCLFSDGAGQMVLRRQWNRGKTQNYEDDYQITGGGHSWRRTIYQRLRQKTNGVVSIA